MVAQARLSTQVFEFGLQGGVLEAVKKLQRLEFERLEKKSRLQQQVSKHICSLSTARSYRHQPNFLCRCSLLQGFVIVSF